MKVYRGNNFTEVLKDTFEIGIQEANYISSFFVEEKFQKGDLLLTLDQRCTKLSFIQSGIVRVYAYHDGKEITQWIGQVGSFMTDLASFMFNVPARWQIQALTEVEVLAINKSDYLNLEKGLSEWNVIEKHFISSCFVAVENRIFDFISLSAEERYNKYFTQNSSLLNQIPLQYVASILGMAPETLSRIRAK